MTISIFRVALFLTTLTLFTAQASLAASEIRVERVQFKRGANSAVIQGKITGYETVDYVLRIREGQAMNVSMATKHGATYFNILAPGEDQVAMFNGSMHENQFEGVAPKSGEYKLRVYMMRSAARRKEVANYRLEVIVTGAGASAAASGSGSADARGSATARRAGEKKFDATGKIPCAWAKGQPMGQCDFGVARGGGGTATVVVTRPDGRTRAIFFDKGKPAGADTSQADGYHDFRAKKESDLHFIWIGPERYEIPDAVVFGG